MCRELTESLLIGCSTESTWNRKSKSNMLIPKTNLEPKIQRMFLERWVESPSVLIQHHVFFDIFWQPFEKFSQTRERLVIGAMSKRGQDTTSSDGSPMAKARPTQCGVARSVQRGCLVTRIGYPVNPVNEWSSRGKLGSSISHSEVGSSQVYRQEMVNLAARKLGQKGLT